MEHGETIAAAAGEMPRRAVITLSGDFRFSSSSKLLDLIVRGVVTARRSSLFSNITVSSLLFSPSFKDRCRGMFDHPRNDY